MWQIKNRHICVVRCVRKGENLSSLGEVTLFTGTLSFEINFFSSAPKTLLRLEFITILRAAQQCAKGPTESTKHYENNNDLTFTLASSCPGCLWRASVSMGVIRRVGLSSQLIRSGCSRRDQGSRKRTDSTNNHNHHHHHHHQHTYLLLRGDAASCQTVEGPRFA